VTVFVTGTDTGCGKTYISGLLIRAAIFSGYSACGMKPVATGSLQGENEDVAKLLEASSVEMPLKDRAVYSFEPPCSPHIAASQAGRIISFPKIEEAYRRCASEADVVVVEGVGGWKVPLGQGLFVEDLALFLKLPVVLVVGIKLGCINHAILAAQSIVDSGVPFAGWVANQTELDLYAADDVVSFLDERIEAPLLFRTKWGVPLEQSYAKASFCIENLYRGITTL
jgi:dethiobiotin synthetase